MDRRYYSRTKIGVESAFYLKDADSDLKDFTGVIDNMSEGGISFFVENKSLNDITIGSVVAFQGYDEYKFFNETKQVVFSGEVEIVRSEDDTEGVHYGCKIKRLSRDLEEYIHSKKMVEYISKNGFRM